MSSKRSHSPDPARRQPLSAVADLPPVDREIIRLLQINGRAPFAQIARELEVSEKSVRKRVAHLLASDVIQVTTIAEPAVLGHHAMALVGLRLDHSRTSSDVAAELADIPAVDYVVITTGRFHLLVELLGPDLPTIMRVVEERILAVDGVNGSETFPYLRLHYQEPRWEAARWKVGHDGTGAPHPLDDVDRSVLRELNADGRAPFQAIARQLDVSESQIRQRVNRMVESGTIRIMAITNPASLGFRTMAWLAIEAAPGARVAEVCERIAALGSITYVVACAGRFDIFAEAICVDQEDLLTVLDEEIRALPGVARVEAFLYLGLRYKQVPSAFGP
jgi:Lrp/AsnC family transcriptional regulator for asnA, asnC and gidA